MSKGTTFSKRFSRTEGTIKSSSCSSSEDSLSSVFAYGFPWYGSKQLLTFGFSPKSLLVKLSHSKLEYTSESSLCDITNE